MASTDSDCDFTMDKVSALLLLPHELIYDIARYLLAPTTHDVLCAQPHLSSLASVNKEIRAAVGPLLFHEIHISSKDRLLYWSRSHSAALQLVRLVLSLLRDLSASSKILTTQGASHTPRSQIPRRVGAFIGEPYLPSSPHISIGCLSIMPHPRTNPAHSHPLHQTSRLDPNT
jgi:hypothetical protein